MNKTIHIGTPEIRNNGGFCELHALIRTDETEYDMWYRVEKEYGQYLTAERADAFIVALLPYALSHSLDIESSQVMSAKLYHQLKGYLIPALAKFTKAYHPIELRSRLCHDELPNAGAVGTGMSGGVDSYYTILKNYNTENSAYNLTHLTFFNVGSHGDNGGEKARELFKKRITDAKANAEHLGLPLVIVDSNISEYLMMDHLATHTYRSCSAVLALQKLFAVYLFSSGHDLTEFCVSSEVCASHDILNVHCLATENTDFYLSGLQERRIDKELFLADQKEARERLNVCVVDEHNCSRCEKCLRTMIGLYALGRLDDFSAVFDVEDFKGNLAKRLGFMVGRLHKNSYREARDEMRKRKLRIPFMAYVYGAPLYIKESFRPLYEKDGFLARTWKKIRHIK